MSNRGKYRQQLADRKPRPKKSQEIRQGYRNCNAPGCRNIIAAWTQPVGYTGPVYCILHSGLRSTN